MMYDPDDFSTCACSRCGDECLALDEADALCSACAYDDYEALASAETFDAFETLVTDRCCECGAEIPNVPLYAAGSSACRGCEAKAVAEYEESHRSAYRAGLPRADWPNPTDDDRRTREAALAEYEASCVDTECGECFDVVRLPADAFPICGACAALL